MFVVLGLEIILTSGKLSCVLQANLTAALAGEACQSDVRSMS
jgi:hypothetical protein